MKKIFKTLKYLIPTTWYRKISKKNRFYVMVGIIAFFIIVIPTIIYTLTNSKKVEAAWFDGSWGYRQTVDISSSTSLSDYQVAITLNTSSSDQNGLIYNGKMKSDCSDIRITDQNGNLLPYWIEEGSSPCDNTATKIWTKIPNIHTSGNTIYVYYGNPQATNTSDGRKVFVFFDDFNASSLDNSKWSSEIRGTGGTLTIADGKAVLTPTINTISSVSLRSKPGFTNEIIIEARRRQETSSYYMDFSLAAGPMVAADDGRTNNWWHTSASSGYVWYYQHSASDGIYRMPASGGRVSINSGALSIDTSTYAVYKMVYGTNGEIAWSYNDTLKRNGSDNTFLSTNKNIMITQGEYSNGAGATQYVDWVRVRKYSATEPTVNTPINEEQTPGPVAYWKFDEGSGTIANDSTSYKTNATIIGANWQAEDMCISGKCIKFDGIDDYVNTNKDYSWSISDSFAINLWVKPNSISGIQGIMGKGSAGGYGDVNWEWRFYMVGSTPYFGYFNTAGQGEISLGSSITLEQSKWYFLTVTYDPTNKAKLYVNGILAATDTSVSNTLQDRSTPAIIGNSYYSGGTNYYFNGIIDDVKIYNYSISEEQIKADFSSRGSVKGVSSQIGGNNQLNNALSQGLIGYWKMDEATWSGTLNDIIDSSGNGLTGVAGGASSAKAYPTTGKYGNAGYFDGVDDYVLVNHNLNQYSEITASAWVNMTWNDNLRDVIFSNSGLGYTASFNLYKNTNNTIVFQLRNNSGANPVKDITRNVNSLTGWHFVTAVVSTQKKLSNGYYMDLYIDGVSTGNVYTECDTPWDRTSSMPNLRFGTTTDGNKMAGKIDEVRFYNRALSSTEVSALYNFAPGPVGYWNFEEAKGSIIYDKAGTPSGTLNNGTWGGIGNHWTQGKYGWGGSFNGSNDYINIGTPDILGIKSALTLSTWVYIDPSQTTSGGIITKDGTGENRLYNLNFEGSTGYFRFRIWQSDGVQKSIGSETNMTKGVWHHVTGVADGSNLRIYINGKSVAAPVAYDGTIKSDPSIPVTIGNYSSAYWLKGKVDEVRIYNYGRTSSQVIEDMNASHPIGGSPIASQIGYWSFDEGNGIIAKNTGYGGPYLNGNINGATWNSSGKFGKAISFDGSNDYVNFGTDSSLNFTDQDFSFTGWFKFNSLTTTEQIIFGNGAGANRGYYFFWNSSRRLDFATHQSGVRQDTQSITTPITTNRWYHIAVTRSGSSVRIFVDGKDVTLVAATHINPISSTYPFVAGIYPVDLVSLPMKGNIDELKVYNSALTVEQIKLDMNKGKSIVLGSFSDTSQVSGGSVASNSASAIYCVPGDNVNCTSPITEWNFEQNSGTTAIDTSDTGLNGTITVPKWTFGKSGYGLRFDGTSSYVTVSDHNAIDFGTGSFTFSGWVKPRGDKLTNTIVQKGGDWTNGPNVDKAFGIGYRGNSNSIQYVIADGTTKGTGTYTFNLEDGNWHHIEVVYDRTVSNRSTLYVDGKYASSTDISTVTGDINNNSSLTISKSATHIFQGDMDNIRLFNYARTPAQVAWEYNQGKPVAQWNFDECQGTTVKDTSGNNNHGTITIGGTDPQTTTGTCSTPTNGSGAWYNGRSGKYNYSISFDGKDDYIDLPDSLGYSTQFSAFAWFKSNGTPTGNYHIVFGGYPLEISIPHGTGEIRTGVYTNSRFVSNHGSGITDGNWHHVGFTFDGSTKKSYIDGKYVGQQTGITGTLTSSFSYRRIGRFGSDTGYYTNGQVDDARIYNYVLNEVQIRTLVNQGSAVRWGPSSGAPN
jgi:hypothetical protein